MERKIVTLCGSIRFWNKIQEMAEKLEIENKYVIYQYTNRNFKNIENLTVAPDTHVIKATHKLGLITDGELNKSDVQLIVIDRWNKLFEGTQFKPIDIHTPLWLWSRNGFKDIKNS